jgi:hypothetical protein
MQACSKQPGTITSTSYERVLRVVKMLRMLKIIRLLKGVKVVE